MSSSDAMTEAVADPRKTPGAGESGDISAAATALAKALERNLAGGEADELAPEALQVLLAALTKTYSMQIDGGRQFPPLKSRNSATGTDVMMMASGLLRAADLAVFELGVWQSWTGL